MNCNIYNDHLPNAIFPVEDFKCLRFSNFISQFYRLRYLVYGQFIL